MSDNPFDWQQRQARRAHYQSSQSDPARDRYEADSPRPKRTQQTSAIKGHDPRRSVPTLRPEFPDERPSLSDGAPDVERKSGRAHKDFKERRDGYESEEGDMHRRDARRSRDYGSYNGDGRRRRRGDDDESHRQSRFESDYDDTPSRNRRPKEHDDYDYDTKPVRRRNTDRNYQRRHQRDSDDAAGSEFEEDPRSRRYRSDNHDRGYQSEGLRRDDYTRHTDSSSHDQRRRREEIYDRDRNARRSSDTHTKHHRDDGDVSRDTSRRIPREIKIGKYDIGPYVEEGQKHYKKYGPILTPIIMNMAKNYIGGKMSGNSKR